MNRWKFTEIDLAGAIVHRLGSRPFTVCGLNTTHYSAGLDDDPALVVTCLRCAAGFDSPPNLPSSRRVKR